MKLIRMHSFMFRIKPYTDILWVSGGGFFVYVRGDMLYKRMKPREINPDGFELLCIGIKFGH